MHTLFVLCASELVYAISLGACDLELLFANKRAMSLPGQDETEYTCVVVGIILLIYTHILLLNLLPLRDAAIVVHKLSIISPNISSLIMFVT